MTSGSVMYSHLEKPNLLFLPKVIIIKEYKNNEQKNYTDYKEIWTITEKFIPVVQFMMQLMRITGITMKFPNNRGIYH